MTARLRGIQILGWLSLIAGYGLALLLIRGIVIRMARGFGGASFQAFWSVLGDLLIFGIAFYLAHLGRRALLIAKGRSRTGTRFGWGRILLGTIFLYNSAVDHFHLLPPGPPGPFKIPEASNQWEADTMDVTAVVIALGCVVMILSGIWRGLRPQHPSPTA